MREFIPEGAKLLPPEAKKVFTGVISDVYQWPQEMFDGSVETFEMIKRPDTVKIIAVLEPEELERAGFGPGDERKIVVTWQEQPRKDKFCDIPGGRVDEEDASELEGAKRELREETGLTMKHWRLIEVRQPFNKLDWLVYTFLATGFDRREAQKLDVGEKIEVTAMGFKEVMELKDRPEARYLELGAENMEELLEKPAVYEY